jgi:hypothetical protein
LFCSVLMLHSLSLIISLIVSHYLPFPSAFEAHFPLLGQRVSSQSMGLYLHSHYICNDI